MAKGTRSSDNSPTEMGELKEMMQNMAEKMGTNKLITNRESGRERTPVEGGPSTARHLDERIHHSEERSHRPRSPTSYNTHHSNFSRWSRMEFLRFAGEDLRSWLFKIEQFFSMENVAAEENVTVAAMQLEGEAIQWHLSFMRYRQYLQPATWNEYVMAMVERFGTDFDDPMDEIKKVKQIGCVKEYQAVFEMNLTRVNLSQENAISCFIGGLKHELNLAVKVTNLSTLAQVYRSSRLQEAYIAAVRQPAQVNSQVNSRKFTEQRNYNSKPILPTPGFGGSNGPRGMNRRTLSAEEMNEKRSKGLCYFCNEKYIPGHKCKISKQLYLLEIDETEEFRESECLMGEQERQIHEKGFNTREMVQPAEHMEISMHALNGSLGYRTLKVTGCEIRSTSPQLVAAANGNMRVDKMTTITWLLQGAECTADFLLLPLGCCGVVLGVQWLLTLGDIKMNFRNLTMEFWYKGRKHLLGGAGNQMLTVGAGKLAKQSGNQSQLCMIHVMPMGSEKVKAHETDNVQDMKGDPSLLALLSEFKKLFEEPNCLPPSRGVFYHRILLKAGTEPMNKRPYRYPSVKKDVIQGLVQQMLDQGIIQPSCSPFTSPVVLVGKKDGSWRLCVDYKDLNKFTVKNKFPIPIVEDLLDELGGSKIFSKIDLRSGYHQLRMASNDVPKTAFRTHSGHYEYLVMPFVLSNAPATFQGLMNFVFQKYLRKHVLVFFDDILIYSRSMEDHVRHLRSVFVEMVKYQLIAKESKCFFGVQRIEYLGHFITSEGVSTDPQKVEAV
ncbi:uncharacterized protein LOC107018569 [Solanum pennellii]|uniref:Uncharacterized protein LOC107018569 n=1 Tax=Solanum pennellii TaxID=28526 RepID=A0ABM1GQT3_SOLPN|nr:uncharacterized protein LOC107018569 [Solanum pennellii]